MPKVSELKYEIAGVSYKTNINCNSSGIFSANLPSEVSEALRIQKQLSNQSLNTLEKLFHEHLSNYKKASTTQELFIIIGYQARGRYADKKDGGVLFSHLDSNYKIDISFSEITNAIGLDFEVCIKETIDNKAKWFIADKDEDGNYVKEYGRTVSNSFLRRGKIIPFNQNALNTLNKVQEKFRSLSEVLFDFIKQDETLILNQLIQNKLLS